MGLLTLYIIYISYFNILYLILCILNLIRTLICDPYVVT